MIAQTAERAPQIRSHSLTYSIARHRNYDSLIAEGGFLDALKKTGQALWIGVSREIGPLRRGSLDDRPISADIYVSTSLEQETPPEEIATTFQSFVASLKPDNVRLHFIPTSQVGTDALKDELRDPRKHRHPMVWEESLA